MLDEGSATDADTDAALALLFASRRWDAPEYEGEALEILDRIWEEETTVVDGERVVVAGDWARSGTGSSDGPAVNPSYLAPYAYTIFGEADPDHQWEELVDSSYGIFEKIRASSGLGGEAGLAPDWLALDRSGELSPAEVSNKSSSGFSFDASRIPWRIALDYLRFTDDRALETLRALDLPRRELEREGKLRAAYEPDGTPATDYEATSTYAGVLPGLLVAGNPDLIHQVYASKILGAYTDSPEGAYWGNPDNYYDQNMAWFATAVMDGSTANLYADESVIDWAKASIDDRFALRDRDYDGEADEDKGAGAGLRLTPEKERRLETGEGLNDRSSSRSTIEKRRRLAAEEAPAPTGFTRRAAEEPSSSVTPKTEAPSGNPGSSGSGPSADPGGGYGGSDSGPTGGGFVSGSGEPSGVSDGGSGDSGGSGGSSGSTTPAPIPAPEPMPAPDPAPSVPSPAPDPESAPDPAPDPAPAPTPTPEPAPEPAPAPDLAPAPATPQPSREGRPSYGDDYDGGNDRSGGEDRRGGEGDRSGGDR